MLRVSRAFTLFTFPIAMASPCLSGMTKDLRTCTAGNSAASITACTRILKSGRLHRNQFYIVHFNRGWAYRITGDFEKALRDFDRAAQLNPKYADIYYSRAVILADLKHMTKVERDLDRYLRINGKKTTTYYNRAVVYRRIGRPDIALIDIDAARSQAPTNKKLAILRALILSDLKDHHAAQSEIDALLTSAPENADSYYARSIINFRQKKLDAAKSDAEKAIALRQEFSSAHVVLGKILEARGEHFTAEAHLKKAISFPAKTVQELYARDDAKARLAAIKSEKPPRVAATSAPSNCRRFLPATGITIPVACNQK